MRRQIRVKRDSCPAEIKTAVAVKRLEFSFTAFNPLNPVLKFNVERRKRPTPPPPKKKTVTAIPVYGFNFWEEGPCVVDMIGTQTLT